MAGNPRDAFRTGSPVVVSHHISLAQYLGSSLPPHPILSKFDPTVRMPHDANSDDRKLVSFEQVAGSLPFRRPSADAPRECALEDFTKVMSVIQVQAAIRGNQVLCGTKPRTLGTVN